MDGQSSESRSPQLSVATLSFTVDDQEGNEQLYSFAVKNKADLKRQMNNALSVDIDIPFSVIDLRITKGSVHITADIGVLLSHLHSNPYWNFVWDFAKYKALCESLILVSGQVKDLLNRFFGNGVPLAKPTITANWQINPAVVQLAVRGQNTGSSNLLVWTVCYLALSHAALLGVLIWLLARHLH